MRFTLKMASLILVSWIFAFAASAQEQFLIVVSPAPAEVVSGKEVAVSVKVPDTFALGKDGYVLLWLDAQGQKADNAKLMQSNAPYVFKNVSAGLHTIYAELVRPDYSSFEPKVQDKVEFETLGEQIGPSPGGELPEEPAPFFPGGMYLPAGSTNTMLAMIIAGVAAGILWRIFGKTKA